MSRGPWIATRHGIAFELLAPTPDMIDWRDIAHALGHLCRWTGHTMRFLSVAEHSCRVAARVREKLGDGDRKAYLYALLHDGHEAYVGDPSAPLKWALKLVAQGDDVVKLITGPIDRAVFLAFGLDPVMPEYICAAIHEADMELLATELRDQMPESPEWEWQPPEPLADQIEAPLNPELAVAQFAAELTMAAGWFRLPIGEAEQALYVDVQRSLDELQGWAGFLEGGRLANHETVLRSAHDELLAIIHPLLAIGERSLSLMHFNGFGIAAGTIEKLQKAIVEIRPGETVSDASARKQKEAE